MRLTGALQKDIGDRFDAPPIKPSPEFTAALNKAWKPLKEERLQIANKTGFDGQGAYDFFRSESK